jgi:hypothetical protein
MYIRRGHTNSPPVAASRCVIDEFWFSELDNLGTCFFNVSYVVKNAAAVHEPRDEVLAIDDVPPGALPNPTLPTPL